MCEVLALKNIYMYIYKYKTVKSKISSTCNKVLRKIDFSIQIQAEALENVYKSNKRLRHDSIRFISRDRQG